MSPGSRKHATLGLSVALVSLFALEPLRAIERPLPPERSGAVRFLPASDGVDSPFDGQLEVRFEGRRLSRTVVRCLLALAAGFAQRNEHGFYNLGLSGEVRRGENQVERFAYRFDIAAKTMTAERFDLVFDRDLRPGRYHLHLELEDLQTGRRFAGVDELDVPDVVVPEPAPATSLLEDGSALAADSAPAAESPSIELLLPDLPILSGLQRIAAVARGGLVAARVRFLLDGRLLLTKSRPPFGVELDFGREAAARRVSVEACDAQGAVLARDERLVNVGAAPFTVQLDLEKEESSPGVETVVRARLTVPRGRKVERVDYFLGDRLELLLDRPPFERAVALPASPGAHVVRVVARLTDGRTAEDAAVVNASDFVAETSVRLVELYVAVVDRRGRSVEGLSADELRVAEDGRPQRLLRFERVADLPLHIALVLDVSASMGPQLGRVSRAATGFLRDTLKPADHASLITFNGTPRVAVEFTGDFDRLANGLAVLRAGGQTEIHEALEFALQELEGVPGQRAVLLFSDGVETNPRDAGALVEYARRGGVAVYTVGFGIPSAADEARALLARLANETGGRTLFVRDVEELELAYAAIVLEMRSRYLVAYQSDNLDGAGFRAVEIGLARRGLEARAARGYYP